MLDIKKVRENYQEILASIESRMHGNFGLPEVQALDEERRALLGDVEKLKNNLNVTSKQIPILKKEGKDAKELLASLKELSETIKIKDSLIADVEAKLNEALLGVPNVPQKDVPIGNDDQANVEIRKHGEPISFIFQELPHWDIGVNLDIIDFERAAKISGSRFILYKGLGAKLERAVSSFMLDVHTEKHGYTEVIPPFMVNRDAMTGTGQLPKFEEDMFHIPAKDFFLVPTAEVPVTNIFRDEILSEDSLPIYYTAHTPCFRKEAGSAGRDTRGLIRVHQFNKVELVKFTKPEDSDNELESLLLAAEEILKQLEIPYRVVALATGDLGFSSAKTYDIEVWMPSYGRYVEISSCSNFEDFQARRANIRFRREDTKKPEFVHTLNGSGLAVGRTVAAILENYQNSDGSVTIPDVLRSYMGVDIIEKK